MRSYEILKHANNAVVLLGFTVYCILYTVERTKKFLSFLHQNQLQIQ